MDTSKTEQYKGYTISATFRPGCGVVVTISAADNRTRNIEGAANRAAASSILVRQENPSTERKALNLLNTGIRRAFDEIDRHLE
jgi:hypothetical protein